MLTCACHEAVVPSRGPPPGRRPRLRGTIRRRGRRRRRPSLPPRCSRPVRAPPALPPREHVRLLPVDVRRGVAEGAAGVRRRRPRRRRRRRCVRRRGGGSAAHRTTPSRSTRRRPVRYPAERAPDHRAVAALARVRDGRRPRVRRGGRRDAVSGAARGRVRLPLRGRGDAGDVLVAHPLGECWSPPRRTRP